MYLDLLKFARFARAGMVGMMLPATALAQQQPPAPAVLVQSAEERSLDRQFEFIGRVHAPERVDLRARVQGFLGARQFNDGDEVKEEQILFRIEREPFEVAVAQREAQLASAKATLENAELQLQRAQELIRTQAVPQATLDARAMDASRAKAGVMEAEAALRDAQMSLSYTNIKSPIAGRAGRAAVSPGNLVGTRLRRTCHGCKRRSGPDFFSVTQRQRLDARRDNANPGKHTVRVRLADGSLYNETGQIDFLDVRADPRTDGQLVRTTLIESRSNSDRRADSARGDRDGRRQEVYRDPASSGRHRSDRSPTFSLSIGTMLSSNDGSNSALAGMPWWPSKKGLLPAIASSCKVSSARGPA